MFTQKRLDYLLILFRLFKLDFILKYHKDYFDELEKYIRSSNHHLSIEESLLEISCKYLYLSQKRFDFCQQFLKYCRQYFV